MSVVVRKACWAQVARYPRRGQMSTALLGRNRLEPIRRYVTCQGPHTGKSAQAVRHDEDSESGTRATCNRLIAAKSKRRDRALLLRGASEHSQQPLLGTFRRPSRTLHRRALARKSGDMAAIEPQNPSDGMNDILQFIDEGAKAAAFDYNWAKLSKSDPSHIDINALKICVRLLLPSSQDERVSTGNSKHCR